MLLRLADADHVEVMVRRARGEEVRGLHVGIVPEACVGAELGAVTARGANLAVSESHTRFWASVDWILRLRVVPADAWFVELDGSLLMPITRYSFTVRDPTTRVHAVPAITGAGSVLLGITF